MTHLFVARSMLAPLAEVIDEYHYKITQKSESVRNRCPRDGCEDVHGVACYWGATSSDCIVTARHVQHKQAWVPCWTEVLFVSRICELWATTNQTCTYHKYPYHLARLRAKTSPADCGIVAAEAVDDASSNAVEVNSSALAGAAPNAMDAMRLGNAKARAVAAKKVALVAKQAKDAVEREVQNLQQATKRPRTLRDHIEIPSDKDKQRFSERQRERMKKRETEWERERESDVYLASRLDFSHPTVFHLGLLCFVPKILNRLVAGKTGEISN